MKLCTLKWLRPSRNVVISLIPLGLQISKKEFEKGRIKVSIFSLKTEIILEFLRLGSKIFHSIIADEKKRIFEKVMLYLNKGNIALSSGSI